MPHTGRDDRRVLAIEGRKRIGVVVGPGGVDLGEQRTDLGDGLVALGAGVLGHVSCLSRWCSTTAVKQTGRRYDERTGPQGTWLLQILAGSPTAAIAQRLEGEVVDRLLPELSSPA